MTTFKKEDEVILVVPRKELLEDELLAFQGTQSVRRKVVRLLNNINSNYTSMRRGSDKELDTPLDQNAELNLDYKQPIPYAVIRRGHEFFVTERLKGGGEARLHGKLSLGAGGHMNPVLGVTKFSEVLDINLQRELEEELDITDKDMRLEVVGYINDDSDSTGRVHIGILVTIDVSEDSEVSIRETEQLKGRWMTLEELSKKDVYKRLENWSKIVVDIL